VQPSPDGLAQAFILAEEFLNGSAAALVLGDNMFYGHDLTKSLQNANAHKSGGTVFGYHVSNPRSYGVVEFDDSGTAISIEEKPEIPKSNYGFQACIFLMNESLNLLKM
jgi:glucose-1-phosphate thymidylyltransferase